MKKILLTGATGFLGRHILEGLLKENDYEIFTLSRNKSNLEAHYSEVHHFEVEEMSTIPFEKIDVVIHAAYYTESDALPLADSLAFSQRLFRLVQSDVINLSSRSVYGQNPNIPWNENSEVQPDTLYAYSKYASELSLALAFKDKSNYNYTSIRLSGLVGKNYNQRAVNKFVKTAMEKNEINIIGGQQQFAYLHFKDAAEGIIEFLKVPSKKWNEIYNLGYLKNYNIIDMAQTVAEVGKKFDLPNIKLNVQQSNTTLYAELDSSLFYKDTDWTPKWDMKSIVKEIFEDKIK